MIVKYIKIKNNKNIKYSHNYLKEICQKFLHLLILMDLLIPKIILSHIIIINHKSKVQEIKKI